MATKKKRELASERIRVFPSSLKDVNHRRRRGIGGKSQGKVIADVLRKASLWEELNGE